MVNLKELLLGKLPSIPLDNYKDWCFIRRDITYFVLLKYPHYALTWTFEDPLRLSAFHNNALFSLIVNGHDALAKEKLQYLEQTLNRRDVMYMTPLRYCTLDDFPPASKTLCQWLLATYPESPVWHYYVTGWSLMGDYALPHLKVARDHVFLAQRLGKPLVIDKVELYINECHAVTFDKNKFDGDNYTLIRNRGFHQVDVHNMDQLCALFVSYQSGPRVEIYDDYLCYEHNDHAEDFFQE